MGMIDKLKDVFANAEDIKKRDVQLGEGKHRLVLADYEIIEPRESDPFIKATMIVTESDKLDKLEQVFVRWYPFSGKAVARKINSSESMNFVKTLFNCKTQKEASEQGVAMLQTEAGTGFLIDAVVTLSEPSDDGKQWPRYTWKHVADQTAESVAAGRARVKELYGNNEEEEQVVQLPAF